MSKDFTLEHKDEHPHMPDPSSNNFNESVYVNGFDPNLGLGGWMRLGNRANEGYAEMQVCLYVPGNRVVCMFQRPKIDSNERFGAGGLNYEVIEPFKSVKMSYEGELMVLEDPGLLRDAKKLFSTAHRDKGGVTMTQEAISPVHGGRPTRDDVVPYYGRDFSLNHFNQHMEVKGKIWFGNDSWDIDGYGWRDHSWGPRYWQNIFFHRLYLANFDNGNAFQLLRINKDPDLPMRRLGVVLVDGSYEEVVDLDVVTNWDEEKDPRSYTIVVRTSKRSAVIKGEIVTLAPLRNRRKVGDEWLKSRICEAFTKFTWDDGAVGYGMTEYIERYEGDKLVGYPL